MSQKTLFLSIILAVESLVRMGDLSHQKKFQNYRPINDPWTLISIFRPFLECKNGPKYAKIEFWPKNLVGTWYNHLVSTAELHFYRSFQGYPTCPYFFWIWSDGHMAIWPYLAYLAIYGLMAIGPYATNMGKWGIPGKIYKKCSSAVLTRWL